MALRLERTKHNREEKATRDWEENSKDWSSNVLHVGDFSSFPGMWFLKHKGGCDPPNLGNNR